MNTISQLWNYSKLSYNLYSLYSEYDKHKSIDNDKSNTLIDSIHRNVLQCGAICIKFAQWLLPILDNIYIEDDDKPYWFTSLEDLYENCPIHSTEYSKEIYYNDFKEIFDNDYKLVDVVGSGSVGQVYKLQDKHSDEYFALKVIHPNVQNELKLFKKVLSFVLWFKCLRVKLYDLVPVNYQQFIDNFEEQVNLIYEANYLSRMKYNYRNNPSIVIPELVKFSENCIIMSYEEGQIMDKMDISDYQKTKIISVLYGFIMSNQLFYDILHNDIHKANWKVRKITDNQFAIVVYDFGFCYKKTLTDRPMIHMLTDMFEETGTESYDEGKVVQMVTYFCNDNSDEFKLSAATYIPNNFNCDPRTIFKLTIDVCNNTGHIVDASAIQIIIVSIQCYKYLKLANINNGNNLRNDGYRTYRERYLDLCNIYETYESFDEFVEYMKNKLNKLNIEVNGMFDVIKDNDTVTDEVKALLKFD
jgi:predicted unusual protein kinase regulating ubiquinone biosynthesis (AarF/ABC1/UbiB family)